MTVDIRCPFVLHRLVIASPLVVISLTSATLGSPEVLETVVIDDQCQREAGHEGPHGYEQNEDIRR